MKKLLKYTLIACVCILIMLILAFFILRVPDIPLKDLKARYASSPSQFIDIKGLQVHYRKQGEGESIILLHGTGASLHTWEPWVEQLQDSFEVITVDLPAFGLTGPHPNHDYSMQAYSSFLSDFSQVIGIKRFHLAGNSLGGRVAWTFTLDHPERVDKLILIASAGYPHESPALFKLIANPLLGPIFRHLTAKSLVRENLEEVYHQDAKVTDVLVDRYYQLGLREGNRDALIARVKTKYQNRIHEISQIEQETLLMWGEHDPWVPLADATKFNQAIKNSRIVSYPDAGHIPMEEVPLKSAADAMAFLLEDSSTR